jgi:hypothetical protein
VIRNHCGQVPYCRRLCDSGESMATIHDAFSRNPLVLLMTPRGMLDRGAAIGWT